MTNSYRGKDGGLGEGKGEVSDGGAEAKNAGRLTGGTPGIAEAFKIIQKSRTPSTSGGGRWDSSILKPKKK